MTGEMPRVTVIIPTTPAPDGSMSQNLLRAVHSVEQQTYPRELVDTHIVQNVEGFPTHFLRRVGAEKADTPWVTFMSDLDVWAEDYLRTLMVDAVSTEATALWDGPNRLLCAQRDYYLERTAREALG